ncbi:MAG: sel1 repeat family protein, partial [Thermoguttaceae bacterium]|nr:sel1 repeat family protein [Thermoguttaceae bacterium]
PALTNPNSAAEYARTLCEIAGRRPFVEQAFGAVGFSPTFRSLRRRVETLGRFGTWGRRAAIVCLVASLGAASFATVRLRPDVEPNDALANDEPTDVSTNDKETDVPTSDEATSVVRQRARRLFATLPALPESPVPPTVAPNDPIAAVDVETLYQDEADRLFFGHSTQERQTFVADAVAKLRSAKAQGEAEYYAALGDYLIGESAFFWLLAGVDATVRDDAVAASAELPALAEGETPADYPKSVSSTELDAALARAEKTADPNFRFLAELHRVLADDAKRDQPARYRADYAEPLSAYVHSPFWREQLKPRPCRGLLRELEAGAYFLAEAAAQGNGDAAASLARYIENGAVPDLAPSGFVAEVGSRAGIAEDDLKSTTADERPAAVAFLYALAGAEAGSPRAQGLVASYYARGFGVERNVAEALRWGRLFYDADVASGKAVCIPPLHYYSPKESKPGRLVPKTLDELYVAETSVLRRLEPLVDVLTTPSPFVPVLEVSTTSSDSDADKPKVPLAHRVFLEGGACSAGSRANADPKTWATCLLLAEAALDLEPTPENVELAELFLRRANAFESRSFFERSSDEAFPNEIRVALNAERLCVTPGIVEANERLAKIFENNYLDVNDLKKAGEFRLYAKSFDRPNAGAPSLGVIWIESPKIDVLTLPPSAFATPTPQAPALSDESADDASHSFVAPQTSQAPALSDESADDAKPSFVAPPTPEFEATIAPIFAKLEKTLVDAKNGNADALTARFNEYFDDATDLYPNGRSGSPEVARYTVERLTQEIDRLEQTDADAATLERLRKSRDSWRRLADASRLADETPVAATNA